MTKEKKDDSPLIKAATEHEPADPYKCYICSGDMFFAIGTLEKITTIKCYLCGEELEIK